MTIDLLVVNYNTRSLLENLLETLHSDYEENVWKLYIADNDSPDDSAEWLEANKSKYDIENIFHFDNIGYAAAINKMSLYSKSNFLAAINADTWFSTNHVKQVEQSFLSNPTAGVIGVKQLDKEYRIRHGGIFFTDKFGHMVHRGWSEYDPLDTKLKDKVICGTVSGSIYYMRKEAWNAVLNHPVYKELFPDVEGAFLPTPMYFEETFFSMAVQSLGWDVLYDGTIETAGHQWHASAPVGANTGYFDVSRNIYRFACQKMGIRNEFNDHLISQAQ